MASYLRFDDDGLSDSGKTRRVEVRSADGEHLLALIRWHGPWRKYVAHIQSGVTFDAWCLRELAGELDDMNTEHKVPK